MFAASLACWVCMPSTPGTAAVKAFHNRAVLALYVLRCCDECDKGTITLRLQTGTCLVTRWARCGGRRS